MKKTIHKYHVNQFQSKFEIELPLNAKLLSVQSRDDEDIKDDIIFIFLVNTKENTEKRKFVNYQIGEEFDDSNLEYLGTVQVGHENYFSNYYEIKNKN